MDNQKQLLDKISEMLTEKKPEEVLQILVENGVSEEQATQLVQMGMQQSQSNSPIQKFQFAGTKEEDLSIELPTMNPYDAIRYSKKSQSNNDSYPVDNSEYTGFLQNNRNNLMFQNTNPLETERGKQVIRGVESEFKTNVPENINSNNKKQETVSDYKSIPDFSKYEPGLSNEMLKEFMQQFDDKKQDSRFTEKDLGTDKNKNKDKQGRRFFSNHPYHHDYYEADYKNNLRNWLGIIGNTANFVDDFGARSKEIINIPKAQIGINTGSDNSSSNIAADTDLNTFDSYGQQDGIDITSQVAVQENSIENQATNIAAENELKTADYNNGDKVFGNEPVKTHDYNEREDNNRRDSSSYGKNSDTTGGSLEASLSLIADGLEANKARNNGFVSYGNMDGEQTDDKPVDINGRFYTNTGTLFPNKLTPAQSMGLAQFGGVQQQEPKDQFQIETDKDKILNFINKVNAAKFSNINEGDELELSDEEIEYIKRNGGQIEIL